MREILSAQQASEGLRQIAVNMLSRGGGAGSIGLVGICRGGVPIAQHIAKLIQEMTSEAVPIGSVDITLYRDDAQVALPNPRIGPSDVPFDVTRRRVVLIDDVLYTGRTVRAAMHALLQHGRAKTIELAVLIDRGGRELPIQPDYVAKRIEVAATGRVEVLPDEEGFRAMVEGDV